MKDKKKSLVLCLLGLGILSLTSNIVHAFDYHKNKIKVKEIADFLGVNIKYLSIECPQDTYGLKGEGSDRSLTFCLSHKDTEKRCELALSGLDTPPAMYQVSFEVKEEKTSPSNRWHSIMQIHSFPDFGEKWRCPPLSVEINKGYIRAYSRWDKSLISKTTGYNCAETGSSITSESVIDNIPIKYGNWNKFLLNIYGTYNNDGVLKLKLNESSSELKNRGNLYNDKKAPYIKLGVYKPAGWSEFEIQKGNPVCVSYKNFKLNTSKAE